MPQVATATVGGGAAAFAPGVALVPVRYVGPAFAKKDNLLGTKRRWLRGETIQVPAEDARRYLKHCSVWRHGDEPWDQAQPPQRLSDAQVVEAMRGGNLGLLERCEPEIYALIAGAGSPAAPLEPAPGAPLREADGEALQAFVPALAQALTQIGAVADKLDAVAPLLAAFPPLWEGCMAAEQSAKNRPDVLRKLAALRPSEPRQAGLELPETQIQGLTQ